VPVRWIDKVFELALERMPQPLPEATAETPAALPPAEVKADAAGLIKH
jgi:ATP-dependent Lon protease